MASSVDMGGFDDYFEHAIAQMSPQGRRKLQNAIGKYLRTANRKRMTAQTGPDGDSWEKRKGSGGSSGRMFKKLRTNGHLKLRHQSNGLKMGWFGRVGSIARIHHYGLTERLQYGTAKYAARELIGITAADTDAIRSIIIEHLAS